MKGGPAVLQGLSCVLFLISLTWPATSTSGIITMRADLTHVDAGRGFTKWELLTRIAARSRARAASFHQRGGGGHGHPVTATAAPSSGEYLIHFAIGTPRPQHVELTLDTGSDLVWTQCTPCPVCFPQPLPMFDPSESGTFVAADCPDPVCRPSSGLAVSACSMKTFRCFYLASYGDKSVTAGFIFRDTFTFRASDGKKQGAPPPVAVPGVAFGCGDYNTGVFVSNESGIAGFGRGPQSLPSQLKVARFSYCLTSMFETESKPSAVFLGTPDDLRAHSTGPIQSTPIIYNPEVPTLYYLSLEGITVGETRLPVGKSAFALKKDGSGGTVIDSGTGFTTFPMAVYGLLRSAFMAQVPVPVYHNASDISDSFLCVRRSAPQAGADAAEKKKVPVPRLVFHLAGADMDLPRENYILEDDEGEMMCLMINGADDDLTLIGNFQQQNMHIVYDVENSKLLFVPAHCDKL